MRILSLEEVCSDLDEAADLLSLPITELADSQSGFARAVEVDCIDLFPTFTGNHQSKWEKVEFVSDLTFHVPRTGDVIDIHVDNVHSEVDLPCRRNPFQSSRSIHVRILVYESFFPPRRGPNTINGSFFDDFLPGSFEELGELWGDRMSITWTGRGRSRWW